MLYLFQVITVLYITGDMCYIYYKYRCSIYYRWYVFYILQVIRVSYITGDYRFLRLETLRGACVNPT